MRPPLMIAPLEAETEFDIAHVLCTDIVGYSKLLIDKQSAQLGILNKVVRETEQFRRADSSGKLLSIPTGDGMVLVFFTHPQDPPDCAVQLARGLKDYPEIELRMGLHSGPVNRISDVNQRSNVAGAGINIAQRVMDCGDSGHILLSKRVAEDLAHYSKWQPYLHPLGEFEVKHGMKVDLLNLYTSEVGNPAIPEKLKRQAQTAPVARRKLTIPLVAFGLALFLAASFWLFSHRPAPTPAKGVSEKSIAILPFKPVTAEHGDEVLEAGMADTLIAKLSTSREIIIPSLESARKYLAQEHDPLAAGRLLHVHAVLEGTLQKAADRIRVTVRMLKVADGSSIWAGTFDEKFTDVFSLQDAIAQKVAAAMALRLSGEEQERLTKRYTDNTEAYQLYLKGRFYWNKYTTEAWHKSIEYFKQALEKDPNYALAYAGLADTYSLMGELGSLTPDDAFPKARSYAETALKLDDTLAEAHLSLGIVKLFYDQDVEGTEKELGRAKELNPNNPQVYHFYSHYLQLAGRVDEAITEIDRGAALDPTNLIVSFEQSNARYMARRFEESIAYARKTLELDPNFSYIPALLATDYELLGRYDEALAELERTRSANGEDAQWQAELARVYVKLGRRVEAEKIAGQLEQNLGKQFFSGVPLAWIYLALGDHDRVFAALNYDFEHEAGLAWALVDPLFDPIRSDPRFARLLRRIERR